MVNVAEIVREHFRTHEHAPVDFGIVEMCNMVNNEITPLEVQCICIKQELDKGRTDIESIIEELDKGFIITYEEAKEGMKKFYGIEI